MEQHIKRCERCLKFKTKQEVAPVETIHVKHPMELVHMDYLTIESNKQDKDVNILVVTDHFTTLAHAIVTPSQTASVVAKTLWDKFFMYYSVPEKIVSDQGRNFESSLINELCKWTGVKKVRTTPYRPKTNGQSEKFNSTLINMIGTLPMELKQNLQDHINTLVHAYNCMESTATKYSPYYLMFGREPNLPIDIKFGVRTPDLTATSTQSYVEKLEKRLAWAFKKAQQVNDQEKKRNKRNCDKKIRYSKLEIGDRVLVRQKAFKRKHKVQDKWEDNTYVVVDQTAKNTPMFTVQREEGGGLKILHRKMIFPLSHEMQCEDSSQKVEVSNSDMEDNCEDILDSSDHEADQDEKQEYVGPVTRSRARTQDQANLLMAQYFDT